MSEQGRDIASNPSNQDSQDPYERYAEETNISAAVLRRETKEEEWVDDINLATATQSQLSSYAGCTLAELRQIDVRGRDFLNFFQEYFAQWTESHFNKLNRAFRRELVLLLSNRGIYSDNDKDTQSRKLYNIVQDECIVQDDRRRGPSRYPTLPAQSPQPDRQKMSPQHPQATYDKLKTEEPIAEDLPRREGPKATPPTFTQTPHDTYLRSPAVYPADLPRRTDNIPSYYYQNEYQIPVQSRNPYELPPTLETTNERLPPEKLIQFQKAWRKDNNYTGKPYDILADKTRIFIDLCRRLEIHESQFTSIFLDILEGRASMYYTHTIGPGHNWKQLYEQLDNHFNTKVNHNQYWTDWTTMSYARCKQKNTPRKKKKKKKKKKKLREADTYGEGLVIVTCGRKRKSRCLIST
ncbi:hypothetical protein PTTW11_11545 [Pyrenophora teres f. teres]|uniref:Uncharacterized protein n=1 Tax=Pyrenophora teres f. teres TaxID=97479 RepID=A0A6S6WGT4_9PLEO|nr:hypothetical protein PTTW11_11545 [Pyrenophora teres f. teres]